LGVTTAGVSLWQPEHLHAPIVLKSGSFRLIKPSGPVQACKGTALTFIFKTVIWKTKDSGTNGSRHSPNLIFPWFLHACKIELIVMGPNIYIFATFSKNLLSIFILRFCHASCYEYRNVSSSRTKSLLATNRNFLFFLTLHMFTDCKFMS